MDVTNMGIRLGPLLAPVEIATDPDTETRGKFLQEAHEVIVFRRAPVIGGAVRPEASDEGLNVDMAAALRRDE